MLTPEESVLLADLLKKAEWPLHREVFHALVRMTISVPIELGVFNKGGNILMFYRDDHEFKGWHIPGTVIQDPETINDAIKRLIKSEVGCSISKPMALGILEVGRDLTPTRHAVSLLHVATLVGPYPGSGRFFNPYNLPDNTLISHKKIIAEMMVRTT